MRLLRAARVDNLYPSHRPYVVIGYIMGGIVIGLVGLILFRKSHQEGCDFLITCLNLRIPNSFRGEEISWPPAFKESGQKRLGRDFRQDRESP